LCQVWIAQGTYYSTPETVSGPPEDDHQVALAPGVHLYGGFGGDEVTLDQRDVVEHPTVISGTDEGVFFTANHVFRVPDGLTSHPFGIVIDGVTITGAFAFGSLYQRRGGGVLIEDGPNEVLLRRCFFEFNLADGEGGAIVVANGGRVRIESCYFKDNEAHLGAGVALLDSSRAEVINCTFSKNAATVLESRDGTGAGIWVEEGASVVVVNSIFDDSRPGSSPSPAGALEIVTDGGEISVSSSIVREHLMPGDSNSAENPLLEPDGRLSLASPAVDAGDTCAAPPLDLAGHPRQDSTGTTPLDRLSPADIGAFELDGEARANNYLDECCTRPGDESVFWHCALRDVSWLMAHETCEAYRGHLATIGSDDEAVELSDVLRRSGASGDESVWIGAYLPSSADYHVGWRWVTEDLWLEPGSEFFEGWDWASGDCPTPTSERRCLSFQRGDDISRSCNKTCTEDQGFVCERDPEL
jgi:hypothetical protein